MIDGKIVYPLVNVDIYGDRPSFLRIAPKRSLAVFALHCERQEYVFAEAVRTAARFSQR
jgi:hypothetical protein